MAAAKLRETKLKTTNLHETTAVKSLKKDDYIEIKIPKVRFADSPLSPLWVILLLIFAFLLGMTTTKIQYLQQNGQTTTLQPTQQVGGQAPTITTTDIKKWAAKIGLNAQKFASCFDNLKYQARIDTDMQDASKANAQATPMFYINGKQLVGAQPFSEFKKIIDVELQKKTGANSFVVKVNAQEITTEPVSVTPTPGRVDVANGTLPVLGNPNAPVKIVEFSDFECPFCRRFYQDTFPQLKKEYIDTGKVALYYRHLPLPMHPNAKPFANAAECANEQGKFWQMHDQIFKEQE
jgi:protein-disulfide isomerase